MIQSAAPILFLAMMRFQTLILAALFAARLQAQTASKALVPEVDYRFPRAVVGEVMEHDYILRNTGDAPLRLKKAEMTPPLRPTKMPAAVAPGEQAVLHFRLDTSKLPPGTRSFDGQIILYTDDPARQEIGLTFQGEVVPAVEFDPMPAFFLATQRGQAKTASIEIINHLAAPLEITDVQHTSTRFTTKLEILARGRRYRLSLTLPGTGIGGKQTELIHLLTTDPNRSFRIAANTLVKERVYAFPEDVDFGVIRTDKLMRNPQSKNELAQPLMIYQSGGSHFEISLQSDLPFLSFSSSRAATKDRFQVQVGIIPERLKDGVANGSILITTNDPEFPQLTVPVKAAVEGSWQP